MKRPEEILESNLATQYMNSGFKKQIVRAMEEHAKTYANHLAESYSELEGEYKRLCSMYESEKNRLVLRTMERDNWEKQFKEADKRCREMGTKNAECWDKINAHELTIKRLEEGLEEAVALLRKVYEDVNEDAINISFEGGVLSEKIKDYLGV